MNDFEVISGDAFRQVLGHLPTGVTVITANTEQGRTGMAANSVTSVSLDPPLVLFCPAKSSTTWPLIRDCGRLCVNVMASHHPEITQTFSRKGSDRFAGLPVTDLWSGPALEDAVAWIECELQDEHDAGDHTIAVLRVLKLEAAAGRSPLVFFRGGYGTFADTGA